MFKEIKHPVLVHKLNLIREMSTPRELVHTLLRDIASFMTYEVLSDMELHDREIDIWCGRFKFGFLNEEEVVFVPVLRAGIPMLEGALRVLPNASSGFIAQKRDEESLTSRVFYSKLPPLTGKKVVILDPMLATGGTLLNALAEVYESGAQETLSLHIVCAPEGVDRVLSSYREHSIYTVSKDEGLNDKGFIVPGLGDMGDRLFS